MKLRGIKSVPIYQNKKILLRVDFNVPIKSGQILDDSRIQAVMPTIKYLAEKEARLILISHLGDPTENSKLKTKIQRQHSLGAIYKYLKNRGLKINFVDNCVGQKVKEAVNSLQPGEMILLENLRFHPGEKKNDSQFAKELASLADVYVNEAFSVSHRAHASVSAITEFLPSYAGLTLEKEVNALSEILENPRHPFIVVMGGAKISTKIGVIENLAKSAEQVLIGGALANNFFVAKGLEIGDSIYEKEMVSIAKKLLKNKNLVLPVDVKLKIKNKKIKAQIKNVKIDQLNKFIRNSFKFVIRRRTERETPMFQILDIGSETVKIFANYLKSAKMIVWNGPMGYSEDNRFARGTEDIIKVILANKKARVVIGGGETIAALRAVDSRFQILDSRFWISMGGGAMLEFLESKMLPGLKPLVK